ncbi:Glycerophosphodiester phosphodiesterase [Oenococcus sicerae]|nr:Glycerophosphodiester phosphodiesterase [Oenococcus sicerae]
MAKSENKMQTRIFAHRGYKNAAPENTLPSFQAAVKYPIDGLEIDVHMTKDHELVVIHDEKVDRTSNGSGYVKNKTLAELKSLDFGSWFSKTYEHTQIMTLHEFLNWLSLIQFNKILLIELKTDHVDYPGIEEAVLNTLSSFPTAQWQLVLQSFNRKTVHRLRQLDGSIDLAKLTFLIAPRDVFDFLTKRIQQINPDFRFVFNRMLITCFKKSCFAPWVVDEPRDLINIFKKPLHAVITNQIELATQLRDSIQGSNQENHVKQ